MQRLENLEITKVAFVPEGDNKRADVLLFKSKPAPAPGTGETAPEVNPKEASLIKRVLLALGKAFGFEEEDEDPPKDADPAAGKEQDGDPAKKPAEGDPGKKNTKGVDKEMKIDKSKLTPEELAQLEAIEKKAGVQEDPAPTTEPTKPAPTTKANEPTEPTQKNTPAADNNGDGDIYKGLHPAVAAEMKKMRELLDAAEDEKLRNVAKKYELLGKKPDELAKTLKSLRDAGGTAYADMISVLDASLAAVEKSGAFREIGSSQAGQPEAWDKIEKHADEILKASPTMTRAEAIDKACEQHPDLVAEYEKNR